MKTLTVVFVLLSRIASSQVNEDGLWLKVLQAAVVDSDFVFGHWVDTRQTETHLRYLGQFVTDDNGCFKVVNSVRLWGLSRRATSRVLMFDCENRYVGCYNVNIISDLPTKLANGKLIFVNEHRDDCDKVLKTVVNFKKGLPRQFFLKCKGAEGDVYTFSSY